LELTLGRFPSRPPRACQVVNNPTLALERIFNPVRTFILMGEGDFRTFAHWPIQAPRELPRLGDFDQFIAVYPRGAAVEGFAQFFGAINWSFRLATGYAGSEFCHAYCVDSLRRADPAEDRAPRVTSDSFVPFDDGRADINQSVIDRCQEQVATFLREERSAPHLSRNMGAVGGRSNYLGRYPARLPCRCAGRCECLFYSRGTTIGPRG
jgi:hypothetical protein